MSGSTLISIESGGYQAGTQVQTAEKSTTVSKDFTASATFDTPRGAAVTISLSISAQRSLDQNDVSAPDGDSKDVLTASGSGTLKLQTSVDLPKGGEITNTSTDTWNKSATLTYDVSS